MMGKRISARARRSRRDRQLETIGDGLEEICGELEKLCGILEEHLPKPVGPGFVDVDGDFVYLGEVNVEYLDGKDIITDSEGNEWHRVEDYE